MGGIIGDMGGGGCGTQRGIGGMGGLWGDVGKRGGAMGGHRDTWGRGDVGTWGGWGDTGGLWGDMGGTCGEGDMGAIWGHMGGIWGHGGAHMWGRLWVGRGATYGVVTEFGAGGGGTWVGT